MKSLLLSIVCLSGTFLSAQTNIHFTNPEIYNILKGNYDPSIFLPAFPIDDPYTISEDMLHQINPDSMKETLLALRTFHNRNTGSDTISETTGIGAARKWILKHFEKNSISQGGRLVTGYLTFEQPEKDCGILSHKDGVAVLPGRDTSDTSIIIV